MQFNHSMHSCLLVWITEGRYGAYHIILQRLKRTTPLAIVTYCVSTYDLTRCIVLHMRPTAAGYWGQVTQTSPSYGRDSSVSSCCESERREEIILAYSAISQREVLRAELVYTWSTAAAYWMASTVRSNLLRLNNSGLQYVPDTLPTATHICYVVFLCWLCTRGTNRLPLNKEVERMGIWMSFFL